MDQATRDQAALPGSVPAWLGPEWPEYRSAAPWVMAEMMASQPGLVAPILANDAAQDAARLIDEAIEKDEPDVVVGCGTSEHGALAVATLLDAALRQRGQRGGLVASRQALEAALDPRPGGVCLAVSHDGGTRATLLAAAAAQERGARLVLLTGRAQGPIASRADVVLVTPAIDRSWCHTVAYVSMILAGAAIGAALARLPIEPTSLASFLESAIAPADAISSMAEQLVKTRPIIVCGSGVDRITSRELALKIEEGPRLPCTARDLETMLHGHLVACDDRTGFVLIAIDQAGGHRRNRRLELAARAASAVGMRPVAMLSAEADRDIGGPISPPDRHSLPPAPATSLPPLAPLLGGAAALQRLTLAMVAATGVNPDLIRREQEPWRTAAAILEDATDW